MPGVRGALREGSVRRRRTAAARREEVRELREQHAVRVYLERGPVHMMACYDVYEKQAFECSGEVVTPVTYALMIAYHRQTNPPSSCSRSSCSFGPHPNPNPDRNPEIFWELPQVEKHTEKTSLTIFFFLTREILSAHSNHHVLSK